MKKKLGDIIMSCLFAILGIVAIIIIQNQASASANLTAYTTFKSFPTFYGILIIAFSLLNLLPAVKGYLKEREAAQAEETTGEEKKNRVDALRVAGMFALALAFAYLLKKVHFILLCFAFLFLSFLLLGRKKIWLNAVVALVGAVFIYVVFVILLRLPL